MLAHGQGVRTAVLTATRGTGGQNEIGPELFEALGVLRTEELAAVHRFDGTEQYFARAIDFGYSFSVDETFRKWGRQEILADYVRLIRTIRPDVIVTMPPDGEQGGAHHQAQARITRRGVPAGRRPGELPGAAERGPAPVAGAQAVLPAGFGGRGGRRRRRAAARPRRWSASTTDVYDPLLGQTYAEIGSRRGAGTSARAWRSCCRCRAGGAASYRLGDTTLPGGTGRAERRCSTGSTRASPAWRSLPGPRRPSAEGRPGRHRGAGGRARRRRSSRRGRDATHASRSSPASAPCARSARACGSLNLDEAARFEIDSRLKLKEDQFQQRGRARAGRPDRRAGRRRRGVRRAAAAGADIVANRGAADLGVKRISLSGFDGRRRPAPAAVVKAGAVMPRCDVGRDDSWPPRAPDDARTGGRCRDAARYEFDADAPFGLPFRPTPFRATIELTIGGADVTRSAAGRVPLRREHLQRREADGAARRAALLGERDAGHRDRPARLPAAPRGRATAAAAPAPADRELRVDRGERQQGRREGDVSLELPTGWTATPAAAPREFAREDAAETVRFTVKPAAGREARAVRRQGRRARGRRVVRPGLPGHRVPAHPPAAPLPAGARRASS